MAAWLAQPSGVSGVVLRDLRQLELILQVPSLPTSTLTATEQPHLTPVGKEEEELAMWAYQEELSFLHSSSSLLQCDLVKANAVDVLGAL